MGNLNYIKVTWIHQFPNEPVVLYSELGLDRRELRKVEMFLDGHCGYASDSESADSTQLSEAPIPFLAEIAADPQFKPVEITKEEFEDAWKKRKSQLDNCRI
jgi:hypothetical protein